jgi:hypothetical protein
MELRKKEGWEDSFVNALRECLGLSPMPGKIGNVAAGERRELNAFHLGEYSFSSAQTPKRGSGT